METFQITHHSSNIHASSAFEDAVHRSMLRYSLRHVMITGDISQDLILDALEKVFQVCYLAGINSEHHFKQIFVCDSNTGTLQVDWLMSKKGFNLLLMQIPSLNEKRAKWLWKLADF